ncbi:hypothetical protein [Streptococcus devriesei]|uniref:hypothetical protein n=1 Tax=Streptococcus devriesei TaxID=231233 RepID=UPI00040C45D7|nr:hypothetical protein [Streptococcus devriesei]
MNYRNIWEMVKVNILYSNPQALTNVQKKREKYPDKHFSAYKTVLGQQLFLVILFLVIYLSLFLAVDYSQASGYFSFQVALFSIVAIVSGFTMLFAVFYESDDTKLYLPLPVKEKEVYFAKLISSQGGSLPFLMPVVSLFIITYWQLTHSVLVTAAATVINFLLLLLATNAISIILIYFIGQILVKSSHKKMISTVLMVISTVAAVGTIFYLQFTGNSVNESGSVSEMADLPYFRGFYDVIKDPFSTASLLNFWLGIGITVLLLIFIWRTIISNYFEQFLSMQANQPVTRKITKKTSDGSLRQTLLKHHLNTLKDATLLVQSYLMPLIFIVAFIGPSLSSGSSFLASLDQRFFGVALLIGTILGNFIASPSSFLGVGISLEKNNYTFIKTLPISFKGFLRQKFYCLILMQISLPVLVYFILGIFVLKVPIALLLSFLAGMALSSFVVGELMYWRDYRILTLNWQNVTQLFSRGSGQWLYLAMVFGSLIFGGLLVALVVIASLKTSILGVGIGLTLLILAALGIVHYYIQQRFWKKIN